MTTHGRSDLGEASPPRFLRHICQLQSVTQNAYIRVAMCGHSVQIEWAARKGFQYCAKREIVDRIFALEQGTVDIKQIGVVFIPGAQGSTISDHFLKLSLWHLFGWSPNVSAPPSQSLVCSPIFHAQVGEKGGRMGTRDYRSGLSSTASRRHAAEEARPACPGRPRDGPLMYRR
jgi:hypothetical protein